MEDAANLEIVQCLNCGTRNRIPPGRQDIRGKCGRCHAPLPKAGEPDQGRSTSYVLRCSDCGAKNRVTSEKLDAHPKCGKCGSPLRTGELFEPQPFMISEINFAEKVLKSPLPVLVYAMSPTCPGCTMVSPHVDAFAREYKGRVRVGRLNIQNSPGLASRFNIMSVPFLLIFDKGDLLQSLPGGLDLQQIKNLMSRHLYRAEGQRRES
ncbi:MAG: thioredoxin domain-containing protein [Syntrophobacteraceae bacterium]|nr:thioredoxin domain-containing protein [Syntrophobacteraceae bacterium]